MTLRALLRLWIIRKFRSVQACKVPTCTSKRSGGISVWCERHVRAIMADAFFGPKDYATWCETQAALYAPFDKPSDLRSWPPAFKPFIFDEGVAQ